MICTNCYYRGEGKAITRGSSAIELILWIFFFWAFLVPPIVYSIWRRSDTKTQFCPECGQAALIPENSPRGIELAKKHSLKNAIDSKPVLQSSNPEDLSRKPTGKAWMLLLIVPTLALFVMISNLFNNAPNTQGSQNADNLAEYEVTSNVGQGTIRRVTVIVPNTVTKEQIVALNDKLRNDYSEGLTHLYIDFFDDKEVSIDYSKKMLKATDEESDEMFSHYRAQYIMNTTTNYNELEFYENNSKVILKKY